MLNKEVNVKLNNADEQVIAKLVQIANEFQSEIHLIHENTNVNCKSIMGVLALNIQNCSNLTLITNGSDENEALKTLKNFLEEGIYA